jgi:hypothetical protein
MVYEHYFGKITDDSVVHHKGGTAENIENDNPNNLMLVSKTWNLHYFPWLAKEFNLPESDVTDCYIKAIETFPKEKVFEEVCRMLLEKNDKNN